MKAFIFVALVASVAARSLDLETLRLVNKQQTTPLVSKLGDDDLLLKEQLKKDLVIGQQKQVLDTTVIPTIDTTVQDKTLYNIDNVVDVDRVLSLQELYSTELFKEYLSLPLFRQYIQYPSFQRFISSVYFQRFYQLPAYKQYFVNPVLFYKYVYPIVQLFNTEYNLPSIYGQHEDVLGLQTLVDDVLLKNKNFLPYAYNNQRFNVPTTTAYPFQGTQQTNYKFLLDKLYKTVVGQEIKTDVKLIPSQKVVVEPITNQVVVDEPKIVDVQVDSKIFPVVDTIVPVTDKLVVPTVAITERDVLLLKELLQKQIISQDVYQAVLFGKINYSTVLRQVIARGGVSTDLLQVIISRLQVVDTTVVPEITDSSIVLTERNVVILKDLLQKQIISQEVYQQVLLGKVDFTVLLRQVLERRGLSIELINLIINRLVLIDSVVLTEQDILLVKELLRQQIITPEVYQTVLVGKVDLFTLLRQVIIRRDVIDTIIPVDTTTSVVLTERNIVLLKDLFQNQIISQEVYQAVLVGKIDFTVVLRQVLERRGLSLQLINFIINRLVVVDSTFAVVTEQDILLVKELLRQQIITPEIYQAVLVGKVDLFTILRQVIIRRGVIDTTVIPFETTSVVLTERNIVLLKNLFQNQIISQEIYEAVLVGKIDFVTILRQVLERRGLTTDLINLFINRLVYVDQVATITEQDVLLLKQLLRLNFISQEIYQAVLFGKVDFYTVLRQVIFRRDVVDSTVIPFAGQTVYNRFSGKDRYFDLINKMYGYKNMSYNTEYPTVTRDNIYNYNRYPIVA